MSKPADLRPTSSCGGEHRFSKAWDAAMKLAVVIVIPAAVWIVGLEVRVSNLELRVAILENGMAKQPPDWLREDIKEIKDRLRAIEGKVK